MKHLVLISALLFLFHIPSQAQHGWAWGKANSGGGMESWAVTTDASGNSFGAGIREGGCIPLDFGSGVTVPCILGTNTPLVWVKYNTAGTPLWAGYATGAASLINITTDPTGNLILFGTFSGFTQIGSITLTAHTTSPYFLAKIDPTGTVLWAITDGTAMGGALELFGVPLMGSGGVTCDTAGNIYITSSFIIAKTTINGDTLYNHCTDPLHPTYDVFVAKYTAAGTFVWDTSIGGLSNDYSTGITVATGGNVFISGAFSSTSMAVGSSTLANTGSYPDAFIAKFSPTGVPLWGDGAGGINGAIATGITKDGLDNVYITGGFTDTSIAFGSTVIRRSYPATAPHLAAFLTKYSDAGVVAWGRTVGSPSILVGVCGYSITTTLCGQVWIAGPYYGSANISGYILTPDIDAPDPVFLAGFDLAGTLTGYTGLNTGGDDQLSIACDPSGNLYACGDVYTLYSTTVGRDTITNTSAGAEVQFVAKYNNLVIADTIYKRTDTVACATNFVLNAPPLYSSYYWSDGSTNSTLTVTTGGTYIVYASACGEPVLADTFHVVFTIPDTTYHITDTAICAPSDYYVYTLTATPGTNYYWYDGDTAATHNEFLGGTYWVISQNGCSFTIDTFNVFLTQSLPPCVTAVPQVAPVANQTEMYPNPASAQLTITSTHYKISSIAINNLVGQTMYSGEYNTNKAEINVASLPAGIYLVKINGAEVRKFVKE